MRRFPSFLICLTAPLVSPVHALASPKVLCVGDALFDCIATNSARGWTVEEMEKKGEWKAFPGGAPANVATALCKLGTSAAFCGCVGEDEQGDSLVQLLKETGVDTSCVHRDGTYPTRRVMVTRSIEGDREFGGFYQGRGADQFADCQLDLSNLSSSLDLLVDDAEWIVSSTLSLAFPKSASSIRQLVENALSKNVKFFVDINWRPVFWPAGKEEEAKEEIMAFAQQATLVKLTDEEAEWLLGIPPSEALENPSCVHEYFPSSAGIFVTAGEKGAAYSLGGSTGLIHPFRVPVQETTGAGDAFTAGILHVLSSIVWTLETDFSDGETQDLVQFAAAVGALTCTREGAIAAQPTFQEVESFLIHGEKVNS